MGAGGGPDSPSPTPEYSCIVGLGDSMIDDGNLVLAAEDFAPNFGPVMPNYHHNNMTNGPVIVEYLANLLGLDVPLPSLLGGTNYAYGAAMTSSDTYLTEDQSECYIAPANLPIPSTQTQVNEYISKGLDPDALHVISTGGNDFVPLHIEGKPPPREIFETEIPSIVNQLIEAGARHIIVLRLSLENIIPPRMKAMPDEMRSTLLKQMREFSALILPLDNLPEVCVYDVTGFGKAVLENPTEFGFENVTDACISTEDSADQDTYLFWDQVHLTTKAHAILAEDIHRVINGLESSFNC